MFKSIRNIILGIIIIIVMIICIFLPSKGPSNVFGNPETFSITNRNVNIVIKDKSTIEVTEYISLFSKTNNKYISLSKILDVKNENSKYNIPKDFELYINNEKIKTIRRS